MPAIRNDILGELQSAKKILMLTGADVSAAGGLITLKNPGEDWSFLNNSTELSSKEGFIENPHLVWQWYQHRRKSVQLHGPTKAHFMINELCELLDNKIDIFTQNVDCLHQISGNKKVTELCGNIFQSKCSVCEIPYTAYTLEDMTLKYCPECAGAIRPNVKWFGENIDSKLLSKLLKAANEADAIFFVGIYSDMPHVSQLLEIARNNYKLTIELSREESILSHQVDLSMIGLYEYKLQELILRYQIIFGDQTRLLEYSKDLQNLIENKMFKIRHLKD